MITHYDFVLVDSRTGMSDTSGICTVVLPDILVSCFTFNKQSINGAATIAGDVLRQRNDRPITIIPVPMRVEPGPAARVQAARRNASWRFRSVFAEAGIPNAIQTLQDIEIPNDPYFAYEEVLAPFAPAEVRAGPILPAFARLCQRISGTDVTALPTIDERTLRNHRDTFLRPPEATAVICCSPDDLVWARWLSAQLAQAGIQMRHTASTVLRRIQRHRRTRTLAMTAVVHHTAD
jgi:hypothetical protein